MISRPLGFLLGFAALGCATQQATSQAMTIGGAAAVVVGASMAANNRCQDVSPEGGGAAGFCSSGLSRGARNVGTGVAIAGAALAAAGYALQPKGPDRLQGGTNALPAPAAPYRLVRPTPLQVAAPPEAAAPLEDPAVQSPPEAQRSKESCPPPASQPAPEEPARGEASPEATEDQPAAPRSGNGDVSPASCATKDSPRPSAGDEPEPSTD